MSGLVRFVREWWIALLIVLIVALGYFTTRLPSDNVSVDDFEAAINGGKPVIVEMMQNG